MIRKNLVPAAQYVRMSTDEQEHSIENQKTAISEYARENGFEIVCTFEDSGESGLGLEHRDGLRHLLADVVGGKAQYKKIIVLDVSRWGRFQDADEAAHYEFVCKRAGINVIYCAEEFNNEGLVPDYFAKILKRISAAEYSRELGTKSFENHRRTVQLGFRVGGQPGYGFRRMAIASDGRPKGILNTGESKVLMSDRVTLVHGPHEEVDCVRRIFKMSLRGLSRPEIARELNRCGLVNRGRDWKAWMVEKILKNPKYAGTYVWNRTTQRLLSRRTPNQRETWILKPKAFPPMICQADFDRAQRMCCGNRWSDRDLLQKLRQLFASRGYLSERLIQSSTGMPSIATYHRRLGAFGEIYKLVGFTPPPGRFLRSISRRRTQSLRAGLFRQIRALFPGQAEVFRLPHKSREILRLQGREISILLCPCVHRSGRTRCWSLIPVPCESRFLTLVCRLNATNDGFHGFHLFRKLDKDRAIKFTERYPWLSRSARVESLEQLNTVASHFQPHSAGTDDPLSLFRVPMRLEPIRKSTF